MRVKHLFIATALLSFMASCNDDMVNEAVNNQEVQVPSSEVVGAELLSNAATINVTTGAAESRIVNRKWQDNDKLAVAWFNLKGEGNIHQEQGDFTSATTTDTKLYANHMFLFDLAKNEYKAFSNVYAGAHFAYYPYQYVSQVVDKVVTLDNVQDLAADEEKDNQNFWLSPKRLFTAKDVDENGKIQVAMPLREVSNALDFEFVAPAEFANNAVLSEIHMDKVELTAYGLNGTEPNNAFYTKATVNPHNLADVASFKKDQDIDAYFNGNIIGYAETDNAPLTVKEGSNSLATVVADKSVKLNGSQRVIMHVFPTATEKMPTFTNTKQPAFVRVYTKWGHFEFIGENNASMQKVHKFMLNKLGAKKNKGISTRNNVCFSSADNSAMDMSNAKFYPSYNIFTESDWYEALAVAKALKEVYPNDQKFATAKFNLCSTVKLNKEIIPANLASDVEITVTKLNKANALELNANTDMPKNVKFDNAENWFKVNINKGVTVNVAKGVDTYALFTNNGTIEVEAGAKINYVSNHSGRINLFYGSYVYADGGIVAYTIDNKVTKPYMVNYLMTKNQNSQKELASVNTLVVNAGQVLDLAEKFNSEGFNDPYRPVAPKTEGYDDKLMKDVHIELNGGSIIDSKINPRHATVTWEIKSINVLNGGLLKDVKVSDIEVNAGEFVVDASYIGRSLRKNSITLNSFVNNAKTTFNVSAEIASIVNNKAAHLIVNDKYMIEWTTKYDQNGTTTGKIERKIVAE